MRYTSMRYTIIIYDRHNAQLIASLARNKLLELLLIVSISLFVYFLTLMAY